MPSVGRIALAASLAVLLLARAPGNAEQRSGSAGSADPGVSGDAGKATAPRGGSAPQASSPPAIRIGALLPLSGASAWYGKEMRQGIELALADVSPPPPATPRGADAARTETEPKADDPAPKSPARPPEPGLRLALEAIDVDPRNLKQAQEAFTRLAAAGVPVVFTASMTPTREVHPLAAARRILVVHQGLVTSRVPPAGTTLVHTRPPLAARVAALAAHAWDRGVRRLALLSGGDEFGKAVRAGLSARWQARGAHLVRAESLTLEASDLTSRLRQLARLGPDAVCLGFQGPDLGDLASRLRDAGYRGPLLLLDDDPAALLAAGPALEEATLVVDAFVPEPDSAGARFAEAYRAKFKDPPSRYAANAYDAVHWIAEALRVSGADGRGTPGGARLRQALLAKRTLASVSGGQAVLRDDGSLDRPLALFTVERGKATFVRYLAPPPTG